MDKRRRIVLPVIFLLMLFFNIRTNAEVKDSSVTIILPKGLLKVQVCSDEIVHITHTPTYHMKADTSLSVTAKWKSVSYSVSSTHEETKIAAEKLTIHIDNLRGTISIYDKSGSILLQENADNPVIFTPTIIAGENTYNAQLNINFSSSEGIFGLGQFQDGVMNYRGQEVVLVQENTQVAVPFLLSSKKYGLMFDNYSKIRFSDKGKISYICFEVADQIDYYFIAGSDMDEVIRGYRAATGQAPLYGKWAYGYWQSKERYKTQDEILNIAAEFRRRKIPIDNIVQDWQYWGHDNAYWNAMRFDSLRYPNPAGMIDKLHNRYKTHLMVSIWPVIGQKAELYDKLKQKGLLYSPYHWTDGHTYDAYSPEARKLYWNEINKGLFSLGVDAFWMDATEPEVVLAPHERSIKEAYRNYIGTMARYLNPYSLLTTGAVYNGQRSVTSEKRVYILSRSAFPGQQRYAATTWSGDIVADWQVFRNQIPAGLNFCMAGLPYWTNDIGGFHIKRYGGFPEGCNDPGYRELYVRWFQFGVFNPIFRSHGTDSPREPWQFGRPGSWAYDAIISYDNLRYRMIPYIYSLAWKITNNGYTLMRGLPMDFPNDTATYRINDQFMFGQAILVNPVTEHMYYGQSYLSETIPRTRLRTPFKQQGGFRAEYFNGSNFDTLKVDSVQSETLFDLYLGKDLPPVVNWEHNSIRWSGAFLSRSAGEYKLIISSDDAVRFFLNGKKLLEKWDNTGKDTTYYIPVQLQSEQWYDFVVEYSRLANATKLRLAWQTPEMHSRVYDAKTEAGRRNIYLPSVSGGWFDFWTGKKVTGGRIIERDVPLDIIPLYVRAGAIIPLGPEIQYATERPSEPIELRIYSGADADFELYDDEGDNYNYEKGIYSVIPIRWNEGSGTLTIDNRKGNFPGMQERQIFNIVWVGLNHGTGIGRAAKPDKTVIYDGHRITLKK